MKKKEKFIVGVVYVDEPSFYQVFGDSTSPFEVAVSF